MCKKSERELIETLQKFCYFLGILQLLPTESEKSTVVGRNFSIFSPKLVLTYAEDTLSDLDWKIVLWFKSVRCWAFWDLGLKRISLVKKCIKHAI